MINALAILETVRGLVIDGDGVARVVNPSRFDNGLYEGQAENEKSRSAAVNPRAEVMLRKLEPLEDGPAAPCSRVLYQFELEVRVSRHIHTIHKLSASARDSAKGLAWEDGSAIAESLTFPGNVPEAATGVISSCLRYKGSELGTFNLREGQPGLIETVHTFEGYANTTP